MDELNNAPTEEFVIIRTKDLVQGEKYKIEKFDTMETKYGERVVAVLPNGTYFLPPRYARVITNPENMNCANLYLILEGRRNDDMKSPILRFVIVNE